MIDLYPTNDDHMTRTPRQADVYRILNGIGGFYPSRTIELVPTTRIQKRRDRKRLAK